MEAKSNWYLWCAMFGAGVITLALMLCEMKDISLLPGLSSSMIDRGPVGKLILLVFALSLAIHGRNTWALWQEFAWVRRGLRPDPTKACMKLEGEGLLGRHIARLYQIYGYSFEGEVSQAVSLGVLRSGLHGRDWPVRTAGQLLLTLGLIGTMLGLASSLGGLSATIQATAAGALGGGESEVGSGLEVTLSGMASAFATTLLGAILGGVFLRILTNSSQYLADELVDQIEIIAETQVVPLLRASKAEITGRRQEMLAFMDEALLKETHRLDQVAQRIDSVIDRFESLAAAVYHAHR